MEENTSIFTNKIIGILVAVVVTACVLVPICNVFANSDDESDNIDYSQYLRMKAIDMDDHSQRYDINGVLLNPTDFTYTIGMVISTVEYSTGIPYPDMNLVSGGSVYSQTDNVSLYWSETKQDWVTSGAYEGYENRIWDAEQIYILDDEGDYYGSYQEIAEYSPIDIGIYDTALIFGFYSNGYVADGRYIYAYNVLEDGEKVYFDSNDTIVNTPTVTRSADGIVTLSGDYVVSKSSNPNIVLTPDTQVGGYLVGIFKEKPTSDSGITGTLFQILPVFVLLAILGSIAFMFVDKCKMTK